MGTLDVRAAILKIQALETHKIESLLFTDLSLSFPAQAGNPCIHV